MSQFGTRFTGWIVNMRLEYERSGCLETLRYAVRKYAQKVLNLLCKVVYEDSPWIISHFGTASAFSFQHHTTLLCSVIPLMGRGNLQDLPRPIFYCVSSF